MKAGLRNARAKGKNLGRPKIVVDAARIAGLCARGISWRDICREMGITKGTAQRVCPSLPKNLILPKTHVKTGLQVAESATEPIASDSFVI